MKCKAETAALERGDLDLPSDMTFGVKRPVGGAYGSKNELVAMA